MTVLNLVFGIFLLFVVTWMAIFGGVGGLLARARGGAVAAGIAWGIVLGPFGWLGIVWTTRRSAREVRLSDLAAEPELASGASWDE